MRKFLNIVISIIICSLAILIMYISKCYTFYFLVLVSFLATQWLGYIRDTKEIQRK